MINYIIVAILVVLLLFCLRKSIGHFRGEGGCCGGGDSYKARAKKLDAIVSSRIFLVEGMSCQHCVNRVMEAVNSLDGVSGTVNLKKGTVTVSTDHPISDDAIKNAIEKAGYTVTGTKDIAHK